MDWLGKKCRGGVIAQQPCFTHEKAVGMIHQSFGDVGKQKQEIGFVL